MCKKYNIHAEQKEAGNFLEKIKIRALKFIILLLYCILGPPNCIVGPPNLGVGEGQAPLDPLVAGDARLLFGQICPENPDVIYVNLKYETSDLDVEMYLYYISLTKVKNKLNK